MREVEQTPIPVVLGRTIAIGQSVSIVILQRSCGTRRRPWCIKNDKDKLEPHKSTKKKRLKLLQQTIKENTEFASGLKFKKKTALFRNQCAPF